jgi:FAD:protein FMN transferase
MIVSAAWPALGTKAAVFVTDPRAIAGARDMLEDELRRIDLACSRFRQDSELSRANARAGEAFRASELFREAVDVAIRVARATGGAVDPTVGRAMRNIGYDRDFAEIQALARAPVELPAAPAWERVAVDPRSGTVLIPPGTELDLGASAKALASDRAARTIGEAFGCGVLVNLGGDIAVAGSPPDGGWRIRVCDDYRNAAVGPGETVAIVSGALATSSTSIRRWSAGGSECHHIVDPQTGRSAPVVWRTVSVAAASCVEANAASTASIVRGRPAPGWLLELGLPSRLVSADGSVVRVAGWPEHEGG